MTTATGDVFVKVRVGSEMYALPIASVLEVAELGDLTALPGAAAGVLGLRNFHGQVLPVFDLAHVLGSSAGRRAVADSSSPTAAVASPGSRSTRSRTSGRSLRIAPRRSPST